MVVSVALALPDELIRVVGQEEYGMKWLDIMFVCFGEQVGLLFACQGRVAYQVHFVLVTVQFRDIDAFPVRAPGDVRQVFFFGGTGFQPDCVAACQVVDAYRHFMAFHSCHRVLNGFDLCTAGIDIDDRIVGHHALVHAVESQGVTFRRPEQAFVDAEFPLVNGLSAHDTVFCFTCNNLRSVLRQKDLYVVAFRESQVVVGRAELVIAPFSVQLVVGYHLMLLHIVMDTVLLGGERQYLFVFVRYRERRHTSHSI